MKYPCPIIKDLLPLYYDGITSAESSAAVETHLAKCETCREFYHGLDSPGLLLSTPKPKENPQVAALKKAKRALRRRRLAAGAIAAIVTAMLCLAAGLLMNTPLLSEPVESISRVSVEEDILKLEISAPFGLTPVPTVIEQDGAEMPVLVIFSSYPPIWRINYFFTGARNAPVPWNFQYPLTPEASRKLHGTKADWLLETETPIEKVYYYTGKPWAKYNDVFSSLESNSVLLWNRP